MASLGHAIMRTELDLTGLRMGFNQAESLSQQSLRRMGDSITRAGRTMSLAVTAPIVGMGAAIVSTTANFESSMNRVRALSQATGADFERLKQQAQDLGSTTVYSASQAADGMSFLAMAGLEVEQIYGAMPSTLQLAAAAQLELADAADIVTNVMTGYNMSVDELENSVDVLTTAFISANTDLRQLGDGMSFAGPVASGLGVAFEEATAAIGLLSNAGIQGGRAGTTLSRILAILSTEGEKLGLTIYDAAGQMLPLADIMEQLEVQGMNSAEVMDFFGQRGGPGMLALLSQGSGALRSFTEDLTDVGGTAERVANTQLEGLRGKWVELTSATEGLMISFGEAGLMGLIERAVVRLTDLVKWVDSWDDSTKNLVGTVAGLTAAVGPLLLGLGGLVRLLPVIATGFAVLTGPVGWITLAGVGVAVLASALSGRPDSLDESVRASNAAMERAEAQLQAFRNEALQTETGILQLDAAITEDGLREAVDTLADTMEGKGRDAFVAFAEQAILSSEDVGEAAAKIIEYTQSMRQELLQTELQAAESRLAMAERWQQSAAQNLSAYTTQLSELHERRREIEEQLASLSPGDYYEGSGLRDELALINAEIEELSGSRGLESATERFHNMHGTVLATSEEVRGLRAELESLDTDTASWVTSVVARRGGPLPDRPSSTGGAGGSPAGAPPVVEAARSALGEVETTTVRTAGTAQELFDAIAESGTVLDQRVDALGGTAELRLAGLEQKAELFRTALARAFDLEDLTAEQFNYIETRLEDLTTEAQNLELMLAGHAAQTAYEQSGQPLVTDRVVARRQAREDLAEAEAAAASLANQSRQNIEDQRREDENYAAYRTAMNERAMREQQELQEEFEQTVVAQHQAAAEQAAARDELNNYSQTLAELSRVSREADAAERARLRALEDAREEARQGRVAASYGIVRAAPGGVTGSEMGTIISTLNAGLADVELRASLFGDSLQLAEERVRLIEAAMLESGRVFGESSFEVEWFREQLEEAKDAVAGLSAAAAGARDTLALWGRISPDDAGSDWRMAAGMGMAMTGPDGLSQDDIDAYTETFGDNVVESSDDFSQNVITAGNQLVSIVRAAQGGNVGGVISGIGGLVSMVDPMAGAVINLFGAFADLATSSGSQQRAQQAEHERNLARSTPAISISAIVNQTNNLQGGPLDPNVQLELDRRTRSIVAEVLDQIGIQDYLRPEAA